MGFFSNIFARKNSNRASLKGQAYNSTVASIPPIQGNLPRRHVIRVPLTAPGTYPVAGNGPNVLDQLQRAARKRSQAQLSTLSQDPAAPPPMVPRFRGPSPSRPTTAPNQANSLSSRPLSLSRSIRSSNSAWSVPERPTRGRERPPPVPSIPTHHRRESSTDSAHDKRNSFIDILDAQGEFRPSNFRSRVAASGAREYGEDVAERNIGENGVNLNSAAAQAFYRLSGGRELQSFEYEEEEDDAAPAPGVPHGDLGTIREAWSRPSSSSAWRSFSGSIGNDLLRSGKSNRRESQSNLNPGTLSMRDRRRSFNAFASPSETEPPPRKPRPMSLHPSLSSGLTYETSSSPPPVQRSRPKTSEGRSRGRSFSRVEIDTVDEAFDEAAPCPIIPAQFRPDKRASVYLEPNYRYERNDVHNPRPESYHGGSTLSSYPRSELSQPSRPSSSSSIDKPFPRSRTMASVALRNQRLDDINEHIPVRTSSLNVNSQASITPTTQSSGFSSIQYPIGHHTPSTSIDASLPPSIKMRPEHENTQHNSPGDDYSAETLVPSRMDIEQHLGHPMTADHDMDLYLSDASEDSIDSFVAWKEKRRDGEGLLMKDNYGMSGDGLPGIYEPLPILKAPTSPPPIPIIPSAPVSKRPKTPKSPKSPQRPRTRSNKSTPRRTRQSRSRTTTPRRTRQVSTSEDPDSDSFWESDAPVAPGFVSLADLGIDLHEIGWDQYGLTEADDAKVDIQTAIKLRKAMEMRKKQQQQRVDDEGCAADVED
ncbi:uncharacterized protein FFB20_07438 [Fusarium fujikuroi]|nr:uncharacterized protein FFB20_07438 [Fusarium fujikuroi]SCN96388.1 uncharacterized protein FFE2_08488 [Fusarium fujikuroi]SCO45667.1 uncharacterized protein FFNC_10424 [Fusarium fujikuroi]